MAKIDIAPLSEVQLGLVREELRFNLAATDEELIECFEECGLTPHQAARAIRQRAALLATTKEGLDPSDVKAADGVTVLEPLASRISNVGGGGAIN
ncbi:hypothetical protein [Achromobacter insuavis]|uniref:hypothetical protein n=1 Tax=Achromobacter insuavis TaxID=1287735 RepID=UPI001F13D05E|nr:hypothetical protein [Achromobacter insuavis]